MENFFNLGIVDQARTGLFGTMFRGDIPTSMVAAKDVGARAVELLTEEPFRQPSVRENGASRSSKKHSLDVCRIWGPPND